MKKKQMAEIFEKLDASLTPARRQALEDMLTGKIDDVPMRQTSFGGECCYDRGLEIVELNGDFSKEDLIRIASVMKG